MAEDKNASRLAILPPLPSSLQHSVIEVEARRGFEPGVVYFTCSIPMDFYCLSFQVSGGSPLWDDRLDRNLIDINADGSINPDLIIPPGVR